LSGTEIIAAALAAGATAGVSDVASTALEDAYRRLKELLTGKLAGRPAATAVLQSEEREADIWQTRLGGDLSSSGADRDEQILAAARTLLSLIGPASARPGVDVRHAQGLQVGDHNHQTNTFN
jgi:hypothetical protein